MSPLPIGFQASASSYGVFVDHDVNNVIDEKEFSELPASEMGHLLVENTRFDSVPLERTFLMARRNAPNSLQHCERKSGSLDSARRC